MKNAKMKFKLSDVVIAIIDNQLDSYIVFVSSMLYSFDTLIFYEKCNRIVKVDCLRNFNIVNNIMEKYQTITNVS